MKTKIEKLQDEIKRLQSKIYEIEFKQSICDHDWSVPYEETMREPVYETTFHGSDTWPEIVGYKDVPCWTRVCKKCEKKETTKEYGEIVVKKIIGTGPIFK